MSNRNSEFAITSKPGQGTTVTARFKLAATPVRPLEAATAQSIPGAISQNRAI